MSHIDYRTDIPKHFIRTNGWLPACKKQKQAIRRRSKKIPLRYFTFCAAEAIDIFMLEREQILQRSEQTGRLESVYFCEKDQQAFGKIADLIGSPEQGFEGDFVRIVLFEEDDDTLGRSLEDDIPYSQLTEKIYRKLKYKDAHYRFRQAFPFDIINLDVFGVMFPPRRGVIAPLLKSLIQIIEWQTNSRFPINDQLCKQFTLFLTSHIDPAQTDDEAIEQLSNRLTTNISSNVDFQTAFKKRYGHQEVMRLVNDNFAEFFCLAFPKFIIYRSLFHFGWQVTYGPTYLYNRDDKWEEDKQYQIMHSVSVFERIPGFGERLDETGDEEYARAVTKIVNDGIMWVDRFIEDTQTKRELTEDLSEIVQFRDQRK